MMILIVLQRHSMRWQDFQLSRRDGVMTRPTVRYEYAVCLVRSSFSVLSHEGSDSSVCNCLPVLVLSVIHGNPSLAEIPRVTDSHE